LLDWTAGAELPPQENEMVNSATLDELAKRIGELIDSSAAKDIERNVKGLLQSSLQRLDLVPREEFELQAQVLQRTREKLETLEARVAEMERRAGRN
jgi:BMFP domain-containing protein YqiC